MRTIEQIEDDIAKMAERRDGINDVKAKKLAAAKAQIDAEHAEEEQGVRLTIQSLARELEEVKVATASHPLEGKTVYALESRREPNTWRNRYKDVRLRGIVTVIRSDEDLPPRAKNDRYSRMPEIGEAIIQRINAKGEKLTSWVRLYGDNIPGVWKLEEEESAR